MILNQAFLLLGTTVITLPLTLVQEFMAALQAGSRPMAGGHRE